MFMFEYLNRTAKVRFEADLEFMCSIIFFTDNRGERNGLMIVSTRVDAPEAFFCRFFSTVTAVKLLLV